MAKNILIIDDSATMRRVISDIIEADDRFHVIGVAANINNGLIMLKGNIGTVDAVLLDINMPKFDSLELLKEIKKQYKTVVVVMSSVSNIEKMKTIYALELGAFDFVTKPETPDELGSEEFNGRLLACLAMATNVNLPEPQQRQSEDNWTRNRPSENKNMSSELFGSKSKLVAIACSTGGPKALHSIIPKLPQNLNAGVVIVQHMPEGFTKSLAERLDGLSNIPVKEAEDGDVIKKGSAYIAKGGMQLRVVKDGKGNHLIRLSKEPPRHGLIPCADIMYESLANTDYDEIICVVLTGMGSDGSAGILQLRKKKNIYVIAQDSKTSVVYGMPKMIKQTGLVDEEVSLEGIADAIIRNVGVSTWM